MARRAVGARWVFPAGLLALLALGAWTRLPGLVRTGLTSDEVVYVGQGGALTGDPTWPAVRAHPPLFGVLLALWPGATTGDLAPRLVAVGLGLVGVVVAALLGRELGGAGAGLVAGAVVALMPYHVDVTRLALVDVPMAAATGVAVLLAVRGARTGRWRLVEAAGVALGVGVLFKETAVLTVAAVALALVAGDLRVPRPVAFRALGACVGVAALYPAWLVLTGRTSAAVAYATWQTTRPGTDTPRLYLDLVASRIGWVVLAAGVVGAGVAVRRRVPGALTIVLAVVVPAAFYLVWPVRGYPYLLAVVVPLAALAGAAAVAVAGVVRSRRAPIVAATAGVLALSGPALAGAHPPSVPSAAGVPGVREAARWIVVSQRDLGVRPVVTTAPWVANVVRHYAPGRPVTSRPTQDGPAVNPAYRGASASTVPLDAIVVWDAWSASADPDGASALLAEVRRLDGRVAHVESVADGTGRVLVVVFVLDS